MSLDRELSENIRIMAQVIGEICHRSTLQMASPINLNRNQFTILRILSTEGDFQINDLARLLDISNAAVSKNIDRLEQLGLAARHTKPEDRRSLEIVLLENGREVLREFDRILGEKQKHLMDQFSRREKEELLDLLKRVITFTLAEEQDTEVVCLQCDGKCGESCVIESCKGLCTLPDKRQAQGNPPG